MKKKRFILRTLFLTGAVLFLGAACSKKETSENIPDAPLFERVDSPEDAKTLEDTNIALDEYNETLKATRAAEGAGQ